MSQAQLIPTDSPSSPTIIMHNGRPATTSLEVAKFFGKRHDNVIRDIKQIMDNCPKKFTALNFEVSEYMDETGRTLVMFIIYRDGFMLLVMGYTGKKAMAIKIAYIEAFNAMEAQLAAQKEPMALPPSSLTPSTVSDREPLRAIVNAWSRISGQPQNNLWPQVRAAFNITNIKQLPAEWVPDAIAWVQEKIDALPKALPESEPAAYPLLTLTPQFRTELESLLREIPAWGERVYRERIRYTVRLQVLTHACMRESERDALLLRSLDRAIDNMMSRIGNASAEYVREGGNPAALISHLAASVGQM